MKDISEKVLKFLESEGFREYTSPRLNRIPDGIPSISRLFQKRLPIRSPVCKTNDRLHINVNYSSMCLHEGIWHETFEIDICGETEEEDSFWTKLLIYGITQEDLLKNYIAYENRLVAAWVAINGKQEEM